MATGALPFRGETSGVIFDAILNRTPSRRAAESDLPPKLEEIINKALEKDRDLRYQYAADLRADLKRLRRDTDSGRITSSGSATPATAGAMLPSAGAATASSTQIAATPSSKSSNRKRHRGRRCHLRHPRGIRRLSFLAAHKCTRRAGQSNVNQPVEQTDAPRFHFTRWAYRHIQLARGRCLSSVRDVDLGRGAVAAHQRRGRQAEFRTFPPMGEKFITGVRWGVQKSGRCLRWEAIPGALYKLR